MYIFRFETFLEQNTPLKMVKLLEFKIEADELFFFLTWKINRRKQTLHTYKKHDK